MKKKILSGSLLAVFLILMMPIIPALEYNDIVNTMETSLFKKNGIKENYRSGQIFKEILNKTNFKTINEPQQRFIILLTILSLVFVPVAVILGLVLAIFSPLLFFMNLFPNLIPLQRQILEIMEE